MDDQRYYVVTGYDIAGRGKGCVLSFLLFNNVIIKYCHNHYYANGAPNYFTQIILKGRQ